MNKRSDVSKNPLGTEPIGKLLIRFSIPSIISMLVGALYNVIDQVYIGHGIGMLGIAATNVVFPITIVCTACALLLGVGTAANFNLSLGAGKKERAGRVIGTAIILISTAGIAIFAVTLACARPLLDLFGATDNIMPYALPYTKIIAFGAPFLVFSTVASNLIRADGSPKFSMMIVLSGAMFNIVFDPIFLFVLNMGIEGIALATTMGQMFASGLAIYYLLKKFSSVRLRKSYFKFHPTYALAIFTLGIAPFFNQLAMMVVQVVLNNVLRYYGARSAYGSEIPLAAVGMISKVNVIFMAFIIGIGQGGQPILSFNYGARNFDRVRATYKKTVTGATLVSAVAFICFQFFPRQIIAIFGSGSEEYVRFAVRYMRIYMLVTFANGVQPVSSMFFTSIGRAKMGVLMSLTRQVIFLLPLIFTLPIFLGIDGVMFAGPLADSITLALAAYLLRREFARMSRLEAQT